MFENLSQKLDQAIRTLKGKGRITDINIASTVKDIRRALVDADVNYKIAKDVTDRVKDQALGQKIQIAVEPGQMLVKIVHDELVDLMGGQKQEVNLKGSPSVVLVAGLQGSGKTTFCGKFAQLQKKQGKQVLLVACDIYRPAAIDQLKILGEQIGVEVYAEPENKNAVQIAENGLKHAKKVGKSLVIVDTAGRLAVDETMMQEVENIKKEINPSEILFVVDSMTGQDAVNTAKIFNDRLDFGGIVLTKLDGDARGGAALSIKYIVNKPIKFISTGEKLDALDIFYPDRMANRILGMGDVVSLVEKVRESFDQEESNRIARNFRKNQFNLEDFYSQIQQVKKMGNLKDLMGMIPGMGKQMKDVDLDESTFQSVESLIQSMTLKERQNPDIIDNSRKRRIAAGSGRTIQDMNLLLKQYEEMRKMMKMMNKVQDGKMKLPQNMFGKK